MRRGPNGRKQEYDFPGYIELVRKYQPDACIFNDFGPDVRWIGNESGTARFAEWAVMPRELVFRSDVQTGAAPMWAEGALAHIYNTQPELGSISNILYSGGLCFCPAETDMSIRPGWFWHAQEEPHSLERLRRTYITSTGGNSALNLNIPPDRNGLIDARDVKRLKEFGRWLKTAFSRRIDAKPNVSWTARQPVYEFELSERRRVGYIELREEIANGQRVETFIVEKRNDDGTWGAAYMGTTVGNRRIVELNADTDALRVKVTFARGDVELKDIALFAEEEE